MIRIFNNNSLTVIKIPWEGSRKRTLLWKTQTFCQQSLLGSFVQLSVMCPSEGLEILSRCGNPIIYSLFFPVCIPKFAWTQPGCALVPKGRWIHVHSSVLGSELGSALQLLLPSAGDFSLDFLDPSPTRRHLMEAYLDKPCHSIRPLLNQCWFLIVSFTMKKVNLLLL